MFWKTVSGKRLEKSCVFMVFLLALLSGCSSFNTKDSPQAGSSVASQENAQANCQSLSTLFSKSNNGFETIRIRPSYKNKITLWDSRYQLIANRCQIWQWSDK